MYADGSARLAYRGAPSSVCTAIALSPSAGSPRPSRPSPSIPSPQEIEAERLIREDLRAAGGPTSQKRSQLDGAVDGRGPLKIREWNARPIATGSPAESRVTRFAADNYELSLVEAGRRSASRADAAAAARLGVRPRFARCTIATGTEFGAFKPHVSFDVQSSWNAIILVKWRSSGSNQRHSRTHHQSALRLSLWHQPVDADW